MIDIHSFKNLCFILVLGLGLNSFSQNSQKALEQQRAALIEELNQLQRLRSNTKKEAQSALNEARDLDDQIRLRSQVIALTNKQANTLTREIEDNLNKIGNLRDEITLLKEDYAAMIRKSYKNKDGQNKVMFLLSSESFTQAYKRIQYIKQYANYRKKQGEQLKERTLLLQELNKKLLVQREDKEQLIVENRKEKTQLDKAKKEQEALLATIRKQEGKYAAQIRTKQREQNRIDKEIDRLVAAAIAANNAKKENTSSKGSARAFALTPEEKTLAANFESNKGRLIWPVERGRVIQSFGKSRHPTLPNITLNNNGVDIETTANGIARAAFKGEVLAIQLLSGNDRNIVTIRHGNYITAYQNIKNLRVKKGDFVTTKQALGEIAQDPFSGRTVLKFLVFKNTKRLNPANWVYNM